MKKLFLALAILAASLNAAAQQKPERYQSNFETGNSLLAKIQNRDASPSDYSKALFYVRGVVDSTAGMDHCAPSAVTNGQVVDMVSEHLASMANVRHLPAAAHVVFVLNKAFPCAPNPSSKNL